jgi:uncharacterized protein
MTPPPYSFRTVFVDSSAYYALADPDDANHQSAHRIVARLALGLPRLYTTNLILAEAHALLLSRLGRDPALRFLRRADAEIAAGGLTLVRVTQTDERRAREILERYQDKALSLTDTTSFAVMERLGIEAAFAFDRDFRQYGLPVLEP